MTGPTTAIPDFASRMRERDAADWRGIVSTGGDRRWAAPMTTIRMVRIKRTAPTLWGLGQRERCK
jgi:hypothetical protein